MAVNNAAVTQPDIDTLRLINILADRKPEVDFPTKLLINGKWQARKTVLPVVNPWDGSTICDVAAASADDVAAAVASAAAGFLENRSLPAHRRSGILHRAADLLAQESEAFTDTIIAESGKPRRYASGEVARAQQTLRFSAEEARRVHGETIPMDAAPGSEARRGFFVRQPLGIVAAITPFNFPLNLVCHKVTPALAAGNSVVLKPASATPLSALRLGAILLEAGLPPRSLNIVIGSGPDIGMELVRDVRVRMITFTGSAAAGEAIKAGSGLKKVTLELGSNSGAIVDETGDLDRAVRSCLVGGFAYSGQVCIHTQRLYLHDSIAEEFTNRFVAGARGLACGDPALAETEIGPVIEAAALEKAVAVIREAQQAGARLLCGGEVDGHILTPTVLTDVTADMPVVCEETFAPIVTIETFSDFAQGIGKFNAGSSAGNYAYGLAAGVFTRDVGRALAAADQLEVGNVYVNDSATFRVDHQPYGGIRDSGLGREGPRFAIEEMTDIKMVSFNVGP